MSASVTELGYWVPGIHSRRALKFAVVDGLAFAASVVLAFAIQFDFRIPEECLIALPEIGFWVVFAKLFVFFFFRQFHIFSIAVCIGIVGVYIKCVTTVFAGRHFHGFAFFGHVITCVKFQVIESVILN